MRRRDVFCKVCGEPLEKGDSNLYHCTNMKDLSHRGLIPAGVVESAPRYLFNGRGFVTKLAVRDAFGRPGLRGCTKIEKPRA